MKPPLCPPAKNAASRRVNIDWRADNEPIQTACGGAALARLWNAVFARISLRVKQIKLQRRVSRERHLLIMFLHCERGGG